MRDLKAIAVFCGANQTIPKDLYSEAVEELAQQFCEQNITLVYGGAKVGFMGKLADAVLARQGKVIGVLPEFLVEREVAHLNLTKLYFVKTMHERKAKMYELADGFILFPGGIGSLDEFFEILSWLELGLHGKPCGILNVDNYFKGIIEFLAHAADLNLVSKSLRKNTLIAETISELLEKFRHFESPRIVRHMKDTSQI